MFSMDPLEYLHGPPGVHGIIKKLYRSVSFLFTYYKGHSTRNEGREGNVTKHPAVSPVLWTQYYFSCEELHKQHVLTALYI